MLVIAVVAGLGAGVTLAAATGSRRASTGWERFRADTASANATLAPPFDADEDLLGQVARLPGVTAMGSFIYAAISPATIDPANESGSFAAFDAGFLTSVYRPRILEGRRADPKRADEITVNSVMADRAGISPGDRVPLRAGWADIGNFKSLGEVTVTGIHRGQLDVGPVGGNPNMLLGNAFYRAHAKTIAELEVQGGPPFVVVRLAAGDAGVADFERRVQAIYGGQALVTSAAQDEAVIVDAVNVQTLGLGLLALAAGLATLVAAVQAVSRLLAAERADIVTLRSLGMRRRDLVTAGALIGGVAGVGAAVLGVAVAVLASRTAPSGLAGQLEPPGLRVEPLILVGGAMVLVGALTGMGALLAARIDRPQRAGRAQGALGTGPLPLRLGLHWTFSRATPGAATSAARAAVVAVVVGMAGIAAVVTFAASLDRLVDTPRLYGWDFDGGLKSGDQGSPDREEFEKDTRGLADDPRVTGLTWGSVATVAVNGQPFEIFALEQARGLVHPTVIEGRPAVGSDEVTLGTDALSAFGLHVGSRVKMGEAGLPFRVVGRAVYPELGFNSDLSSTGAVTADALERLQGEPSIAFALVNVRPGADAAAVLGDHDDPGVVDSGVPFVPPRVANIQGVGDLPWIMAGFLAVLAVTAVGHALALSVRARRRELAVLRAMGAVRRQVAAAVWSQATLTAVLGSLVGVPLGVALGRQAWALVADGVGVVDAPATAWALLGASALSMFAVANLIASGPAWLAARLRPAAVLRSE